MASNCEICPSESKKRKRSVGLYCAVDGCYSHVGLGDTLHRFPKDTPTRQKWIEFVLNGRDTFGPSFGTPGKYSAICHLHFEKDCYPKSQDLMKQFGIRVKRNLIPGSIPTIPKPSQILTSCPCSTSTTTTVITTTATRPSTVTTATACMDRPVTSVTTTTTSRTVSSSATIACTLPVSSTPAVSLPFVKTVRGAFQKRERKRVLSELLGSTLPKAEVEAEAEHSGHFEMGVEQQTVNSSCQTERPFEIQGLGKKTFRSKGTQVNQARTVTVSIGMQCDCTGVLVKTQAVQCCLELDAAYQPSLSSVVEFSETEPVSETGVGHEASDFDKDYCPSTTDSDRDTVESPTKSASVQSGCTDAPADRDRKFIVYEKNILDLFHTCHSCRLPARGRISYIEGTMVKVTQDCGLCGFSTCWYSQPFVNNIPAGNLMMSAAILFSGSLIRKALRFLGHMGVAAVTERTVHQHQTAFLQPAVVEVWQVWQDHYLATTRQLQKAVTLGGDGRADSPGHCAKFGIYSLMDLDLMQLCIVELVQSNEVQNSGRMELEGLKRAVKVLEEHDIDIEELVTDRHPQVLKHVRENMPTAKHTIDVWHVSKGLKKKLLKLAKEKDCGELHHWMKSINHHLYWVAASTPNGDRQLMMEKWTSLGNHVHNHHTHKGKAFPVCLHPPLDGQRKKKWLKEGTKVSVKLLEILDSKQLAKNISMLSTGPQTAALESFHAVLNHFAPKMVAFSYEGMHTRTLLAALHYNENRDRGQAEDKTGKKRYQLSFKKSKGDFTLQEVKEDQTFGYVSKLIQNVMQRATYSTLAHAHALECTNRQCPDPISSSFPKPDKDDAIIHHQSRYAKPTEK